MQSFGILHIPLTFLTLKHSLSLVLNSEGRFGHIVLGSSYNRLSGVYLNMFINICQVFFIKYDRNSYKMACLSHFLLEDIYNSEA